MHKNTCNKICLGKCFMMFDLANKVPGWYQLWLQWAHFEQCTPCRLPLGSVTYQNIKRWPWRFNGVFFFIFCWLLVCPTLVTYVCKRCYNPYCNHNVFCNNIAKLREFLCQQVLYQSTVDYSGISTYTIQNKM